MSTKTLTTAAAATCLAIALAVFPALAPLALADDAAKPADAPALVPPAPKPAVNPNATPDTPPAADAAANTPAPATGQSSGWNAEVAPSTNSSLELDAKQAETVKKVSDYFNSLANLKGAFVQTTADNKRMKGNFLVKRPGRFRFDYSLPSKQIIISDGEYLAIQDHDLNHEDRVALDQTPFRLLLRKDVDLGRDAKILEVQQSDEQIILTLRDKSPDAPGKIRLTMQAKPELTLKEWVSTDAQGLDTRVEVSQLSTKDEIDANLFKIQTLMPNALAP